MQHITFSILVINPSKEDVVSFLIVFVFLFSAVQRGIQPGMHGAYHPVERTQNENFWREVGGSFLAGNQKVTRYKWTGGKCSALTPVNP